MPFTNKLSENATVLSHLVDIIKKMPIGEQYALLEELKERFPQLKRKNRRLPIRSIVEYTTKYTTDKGFVQNISTGGVFIETRMPFHPGENISFNLEFPRDSSKQTKIEGKIIRVSPNGIGVAFEPLSEEQKLFIKSLLDNL